MALVSCLVWIHAIVLSYFRAQVVCVSVCDVPLFGRYLSLAVFRRRRRMHCGANISRYVCLLMHAARVGLSHVCLEKRMAFQCLDYIFMRAFSIFEF